MTMLTHAHGPMRFQARDAVKAEKHGAASHIAMIKHFAKCVSAIVLIAIVAMAVASIKFAIYYPRFFQD